MAASSESPAGRPWLLLIHQVAPKPDYLRVKVRRRLHKLGAVALKNSVYVLPASDAALEDFTWLAREIVADGGEATVCEAAFVSGISDADLTALFEQRPADEDATAAERLEKPPNGATWVTRRDVHVDRLASAWLIRRFIDPAAQFKFVAARGYRPAPGELRFDMFDGEYTHEGEHCTFETLLARFRLRDPALRAIAEIVHDIDCKDERFAREEAPGIDSLVRGIARANADDATRVERATALWDDLYTHFHEARR